MEWISVKDRLPEIKEDGSDESEVVAILDEYGSIYVGFVNFYPAGGYRKEDVYRWTEKTSGCGCCCGGLMVTHWMKLPEKP
jgi:hypothetical protein